MFQNRDEIDQTRDQVRIQVKNPVWNQIRIQVWDQVYWEVEIQVWDEINNHVEQVETELWNQVY